MLDEIKSWAGLLATLLGIGSIVYTWLTARSAANSKTLDAHTSKLTEHDRRIQAVEAEQKHAPRKEDVYELKVAIVELQGTVKAQNAQLAGVAQLVSNIDSYMRKGD
ncbi:DUF2730 family protein [Devosia sp.]|uniref:DUF2730 family protein n=1 Tax=Devosia sp. TaxID=1871048 RepID=UPI001AD346BA|nr:DUF2730 family protein [Devosia sp.]MBN9333876.1 DUF2730 family protein [Devosia sp.]